MDTQPLIDELSRVLSKGVNALFQHYTEKTEKRENQIKYMRQSVEKLLEFIVDVENNNSKTNIKLDFSNELDSPLKETTENLPFMDKKNIHSAWNTKIPVVYEGNEYFNMLKSNQVSKNKIKEEPKEPEEVPKEPEEELEEPEEELEELKEESKEPEEVPEEPEEEPEEPEEELEELKEESKEPEEPEEVPKEPEKEPEEPEELKEEPEEEPEEPEEPEELKEELEEEPEELEELKEESEKEPEESEEPEEPEKKEELKEEMEEEDEEDLEEELWESEINHVRYWITGTENGKIYAMDLNSEENIGEQVGKYVNNVPIFFKKKN